MLKLIRLKLLIVSVAVCLLLFVTFGGRAFASSAPHPHLAGPGNVQVQASTGCANINEQSMQLEFISRSAYEEKEEQHFLEELQIKFGDHILIPEGGFGYDVVPVGSDGTFSTVYVVCGFYALPSSVEYIAQDETTFFYTNTVTTTVKP